uniref:Uncharacterized protein n=1 Tax=Mus musculus TaxID=10090 RepID=Q78V97_MOUSE|nr:unnamed protein product [Mus musculus]
MPPCILFYLKFLELNSGTEIYTRSHVASPGYCGMHIGMTVFIFKINRSWALTAYCPVYIYCSFK